LAWLGLARQARQGKVSLGWARTGKAGKAGMARLGLDGQGAA